MKRRLFAVKKIVIALGILCIIQNQGYSQTSGILSQNLVIDKNNSPFVLTGDLQIPQNLSLTINEGVIFDGAGHSIKTKGNITANGTAFNPIQIKNLTIYGLSGLPILDFNYCIINNSNLTKPTGNSDNPKQFNLRNSYFNTQNKFVGNDATIYIYQFPTLIQNNIFENAPTIVNTFVKSGENVTIKNNNFISWPTNIYYKGLITLDVYDSSKYQISGNCFVDTTKIACTYESSFFSREFSIKNNYWGTNITSTIDKMIYDVKDNISFLELKYNPYLNSCPTETPKYMIPKLKKGEINLVLQNKPPQKNSLIGSFESVNIDSSLFKIFNLKLKNKIDSQFVTLNGSDLYIKDSTRFSKANTPLKIYLQLDNGISLNTDSIIINTVCPVLTKPIFNTSKYLFCSGDSLKLTVTNTNKGDTLKWYYGTKSDLTNISNKTFTDSTKLFVTRTDSIGCIISSDTIQLSKFAAPVKPTIAWNGTQFTATTSSTGVNYQWLLSNSSVTGATSTTYKPTAIGSYKIQITDANGCKNVSDSFSLVVTAVNSSIETSADHIAKIAPNPASTDVSLYFKQKPTKTLTIRVLNLKGQVLKQITTNSQSTHISVSEILSGNYIIEIIGKGYNQTQQLLITK